MTDAAAPLLLVVTGPPASGKTSVARELARRLELPFIVKDTLKERLYEVFGSEEALEERIDDAALAMLFAVVDSQLEAGVSVAAESNFDARSDMRPLRDLCSRHDARLVQVHCTRPAEEIAHEFARRAESGERHPGHGDRPEDVREVLDDLEAGRWDALDLPGELIEVNVDDVDVDELAARLRD